MTNKTEELFQKVVQNPQLTIGEFLDEWLREDGAKGLNPVEVAFFRRFAKNYIILLIQERLHRPWDIDENTPLLSITSEISAEDVDFFWKTFRGAMLKTFVG